MRIFKKKYEVKRNEMGFLYRNNRLEQEWTPGHYEIWDMWDKTELVTLPAVAKTITVTNQDVLTADNVALRFSFMISYKIANGALFLSNFDLASYVNSIYRMNEAETSINGIAQLEIRNKIASIEAETLNERRGEISNFRTEKMMAEAAAFGIEITEARLKDITFPKMIQDLFAKQLESKIRSKTELENARTAVATARTLKNAAELMKENEYIRFIKYMDTISRIAEKGKNTFVIGDVSKVNY